MVWYSFSVRNLLVYAFLKCYAGEIYNHLKVNTDQRTSLSSSSLNSILCIKLRQIKLPISMTNLLRKLCSIGKMTNLGDRSKREESHTTKGNHRRIYANSITLSKHSSGHSTLRKRYCNVEIWL